MTIEEVQAILESNSLKVVKNARLPNDSGTRLALNGGGIINVFDSGKLSVQGKGAEMIKALFDAEASNSDSAMSIAAPVKPTRVFVVYGHDGTSRTQLEAMLRRWGLDPLILDQLPNEGQTIIEKLEDASKDVHFGVVLATPDDEGFRANREDERAYRARQNVVLELGMLLTMLGRKKVVVLFKQQDNMERPSDIQGLLYIPFRDDIAKDAGVLLAKELATAGFDIDIKKL